MYGRPHGALPFRDSGDTGDADSDMHAWLRATDRNTQETPLAIGRRANSCFASFAYPPRRTGTAEIR